MSDRTDNPHELIGPTGVSAGSGYFALEQAGGTLRLAAGRCYVNGRACVLEGAEPLQFPTEALATPGIYLIYLDAIEQDPARDDPFFLQRPALGQAHPYGDGLRTLFQPRPLLLRDGEGRPFTELAEVDPRPFETGWRPPEAARGTLQARANGDIAADALYRVEIHQATVSGEILFKSSANNGMTASRLLAYGQEAGSHVLHLESTTVGYPQGAAFGSGKWVEVVQYVSALERRAFLGTIAEVTATSLRVAWQGPVPPGELASLGRVVVRQWDRVVTVGPGEIAGLDAGGGPSAIEVRFVLEGGQRFLPGDFWLLRASRDQNTLLWPEEDGDGADIEDGFVGAPIAPDGIVHHYCPIGLVKRDPTRWVGEVRSVLPQLETITQVATEIDVSSPSDGRVPTERAVTEYVEGLRAAVDFRLQALHEVTTDVAAGKKGAGPSRAEAAVSGYRISGSLQVEAGLRVQGRIRDSKGELMPVGGIILWSGTAADIPAGWVLCDGSAPGVPDLRERFIVGAGPDGGSANAPGTMGGPDSHTHQIAVPSVEATTSSAPAHAHSLPSQWLRRADFQIAGGTEVASIDIRNTNPATTQVHTSGAHDHKVTLTYAPFTSAASTTESRPRWYALCFIMKT